MGRSEDGYCYPDGEWMYEGLNYLKDGDDFTVYHTDGSVLWSGVINQDSKTGAISHTAIPNEKVVKLRGWKQQAGGGRLVGALDPKGYGTRGLGGVVQGAKAVPRPTRGWNGTRGTIR